MSGASQRIIPLLAAAALGMVSGAYIFDPILRQYAQDTNGTFRPEDASSSSSSGGTTTAAAGAKASTGTGTGPAQSFTSAGEAREPSSGGVGNASVLSSLQQASSSSSPSSISTSTSSGDGGAQARAEKQRELAVSNASARAVEAMQDRARKTGEGEVFTLGKGR